MSSGSVESKSVLQKFPKHVYILKLKPSQMISPFNNIPKSSSSNLESAFAY